MPFASHRFPIKIISCSRLSSVLQLDAHPESYFQGPVWTDPPCLPLLLTSARLGSSSALNRPTSSLPVFIQQSFAFSETTVFLDLVPLHPLKSPPSIRVDGNVDFVANRDLDMSSVFLSMAHRLPVTESLGLFIKNMESEFPDGDQELPIWFVGSLKFEIPASNKEGIILPLKPLLHRAFIEF